MNVNPPIAWTSSSDPVPPQQTDPSSLEGRIHEDITQAVCNPHLLKCPVQVHLFLVDWKYPVDGINVTLDALQSVMREVVIVNSTCEDVGYVANGKDRSAAVVNSFQSSKGSLIANVLPLAADHKHSMFPFLESLQ